MATTQFLSSLLLLVTVSSNRALQITSAKYYIDGSALVIFNRSISAVLESDVLDSTLYSQISANHAYDHFSEFTQWYAGFTKSLEALAWTIYSSDFKLFLDNESLSNQEAVKKVIVNNFDERKRTLIYNGLDKLKSEPSLENFFSGATSKGNFSNFQVIVIDLDNTGDITMSYTGYVINVVSDKLRLLFTSSGLGTIKDEDYSFHRKDVSTFLGSDSKNLIREFKL